METRIRTSTLGLRHRNSSPALTSSRKDSSLNLMIQIAKAVISDIDEIQKIRRITWLETYPNEKLGITKEILESEFSETPEEAVENRKRREGWFKDSSNYYLMAKDGDNSVGFIICNKGPEYNRIMAAYVLPNYQRRGIGKMLMEKGLEWLGSNKDILVNVASYNQKAQEFYRKFGFELTGKDVTDAHRPLAFGKVIPEVEMKKPTKPQP